jgi:hypothetical protein
MGLEVGGATDSFETEQGSPGSSRGGEDDVEANSSSPIVPPT